jgi:hypothetical protein
VLWIVEIIGRTQGSRLGFVQSRQVAAASGQWLDIQIG